MDNLARHTLTPLLLRLMLAVVFIYNGMGKLGPEKNWGTDWHPGDLHAVLQAAVAWGEVLGGLALALGFLTRLAATGISAIMVGAIVTVTGKNGFSLAKHGYEYNACLIVMAACVVLLGSGMVGLDYWLWRKDAAPSSTPTTTR